MKKEFSKVLLIQESILLWIVTLASFGLAYLCISSGYIGELPWISVLIGLPWSAYGVSQAFYYKKAQAENVEGGIKYMTVEQEFKS